MRSIPTSTLRQQVIRISRHPNAGRVRLHLILIAGLSIALLIA